MGPEHLQKAIQQTIGSIVVQLITIQEEAAHLAEQLGGADSAGAGYTMLEQCIKSERIPNPAAILDADRDFAAWYKARA